VVVDRVQYENGYLVVPRGPGLGMELSEANPGKLTDRNWGFLKQ
jgi:L-alanine-DL-glutamate epimerase-like enolase superfamily enzyme